MRSVVLLFLGLFVCLSRGQQTTPPLTTLPTSSPNASSPHRGGSQLLPVAHTLLQDLQSQSLSFSDDREPSSSAAFERPLSKVDFAKLYVVVQ